MLEAEKIWEQLQQGRAKRVQTLVQQALEQGIPAREILEQGLLPGMAAVVEKFRRNEIFMPEVLIAAWAMNAGVTVLRPLLSPSTGACLGRVCIGTVQGDLHDVGKNLVKMMMECQGLEVVDLGTDVAPEVFIQAAIRQNCQVICCSGLLSSTVHVMGDVVRAACRAGIRSRVKIMVGGAAVTEEFCRQIGADVYTPDAVSAAEKALELCRQSAQEK